METVRQYYRQAATIGRGYGVGGTDYDFKERWILEAPWDGVLEYRRRRPGRLRDREALDAVIGELTRIDARFSITVNDLEASGRDALAILDGAGPTVRNLFMQTDGTTAHWAVQFYSRPSPVTMVRGPVDRGSDLNRLTSIIDAHTRWLGWRGWTARHRWFRWAAPSVVQRATRDARRDARTRWIATAFGFIGGLVASVIGQLVAAALGRG